MEFIKTNYVDNLVTIVPDSNTTSASNIYNSDVRFQWISSGKNDDSKTASVTIQFQSTLTVSRVALMEMNWKQFIAFYNGATANTFALSGADTSTVNYTNNSDENKYYTMTPVACTSVTFEILKTHVANSEKAIGYLHISDSLLSFERNPSYRGYDPTIIPKQAVHKMSDGGTMINKIQDKWQFNLSWEYLGSTETAALRSVFNDYTDFVFVPFGTSTSWDAVLAPVSWTNNFEFYQYSDNASGAGYSGKIKLEQL